MRWLVSFWRFIRPLFRWKYSGALIPALYGIGITIAVAGPIPLRFFLAFTLVFFGGVYSVTFWVTSDWLRKQRSRLHQREIKRNAKRLAEETAILNRTRNGVTALIGVVTVSLLLWVYFIRASVIFNELKQARDDVFDHLGVEPAWLPESKVPIMQVMLSNGGHPDMADHTVTCTFTSLYTPGVAIINSYFAPPSQRNQRGLLGGGRGETLECVTMVAPASSGVDCADAKVDVDFTVVDQPEFPLRKSFWFRYDRRLQNHLWTQITANDNAYDYCDREYGTDVVKGKSTKAPQHK